MRGRVEYGARALAVALVVVGVSGGCARLKPSHATPATEAAVPKRTGEAVLYPPAETPGATNRRVTQANIRKTICQPGWTATVRPPASYTATLKQKQLAALGATVADPHQKCMPKSANPKCYEEDYLISLDLGGAPRDLKNLWPQPYKPAPGAKEKDWVEDYLHRQVCAGKMTLEDAQHALVTDWYAVYAKHHESKRARAAGSSGSPTAGARKQPAAQ